MKMAVAIVGMACRFPDGAASPKEFWRRLCEGRNAVREIPESRWDTKRFFDEDPKTPGKNYISRAALLGDELYEFDPLFFGLSHREAESIDPQQRLMLVTAWEALEDAGLTEDQIAKSDTGVFVGGFNTDAQITRLDSRGFPIDDSHVATTTSLTMLAARVAHVLDLKGPALSIDTACSSSMVAAHYACLSLQAGDCHVALVGGANAILIPTAHAVMCKGKFLSPTGACHMFDASADGYVRGEGAGCLVLKRFEDATRDGDRIHAVIRATGVNQDGETPGITSPSSEAQYRLQRRVFAEAGIRGSDIDYVEAHGTGTQAGDLAEVSALDRTLRKGRTESDKCLVGSVKTNIGHLEAAAGVASLIKAALVLKYKKVPPNLHFVTPNPELRLERRCIEVPTSLRELPTRKGPNLIAVNSFGYGGTNAHLIMESAPEVSLNPVAHDKSRSFIVPISARAPESIPDQAKSLATYLRTQDTPLQDVVHTLVHRRCHHKYRVGISADDREHLLLSLDEIGARKTCENAVEGTRLSPDAKTVFVYSGMGPQWWGMGRQLYEDEPLFRRTLDECDELFQKLSGWSFRDAMLADKETASRVMSTQVAQPANFALQLGLTKVLDSYGVRPDAVMGHSVGEITTACVSGALNLEHAILVSYHRSRLQATTSGTGGMLAVGLTENEAAGLITQVADRVSIAAVNAPEAVTLSGDMELINQLKKELDKHGIFARLLRVEVPYHSQGMNPIEKQLREALALLRPNEPRVQAYSTVTSMPTSKEDWDANYWWHNVRKPVRFADTIKQLIEDKYTRFLEVGPHPILYGYIRQIASGLRATVQVSSTLKRGEDEGQRMRCSAAFIWASGGRLDWGKATLGGGSYAELPYYVWNNQACWSDTLTLSWFKNSMHSPWLYEALSTLSGHYRAELCKGLFPWITDHLLDDQVVFPGAGYIAAGLALADSVKSDQKNTTVVLTDVRFHNMLVVEKARQNYLGLQHHASTHSFRVTSDTGIDGITKDHCVGQLYSGQLTTPDKLNLKTLIADWSEVSSKDIYQSLAQVGLNYGPSFKTIETMYVGHGSVLVQLRARSESGHHVHTDRLWPPMVDGIFQSALALDDSLNKSAYVPASIERVVSYRPMHDDAWALLTLQNADEYEIRFSVLICNNDGSVCAQLETVSCRAVRLKGSSVTDPSPMVYSTKFNPISDIQTFRASEELSKAALTLIGAEKVTLDLVRALEPVVSEITSLSTSQALRQIMPPSRDRWIVVWLNVLDMPTVDDPDAAERLLARSQEMSGILQHLSVVGVRVQFIIVTRGGFKAGEESSTFVPSLGAGALWAQGRVARTEIPCLETSFIDLDPEGFTDWAEISMLLLRTTDGQELAVRGDQVLEHTLEQGWPEPTIDVRGVDPDAAVELVQTQRGSLKSLELQEIDRCPPGPNQVEIQAFEASLSFKDFLKFTDSIGSEALEETFFGNHVGMVGSGVIKRIGPGCNQLEEGQSVMYTDSKGVFRTYLTTESSFVVPLPECLGTSDPGIIGAITAHRALVDLAGLRKNETVLIHNAAGTVGLYALQIAKNLGARVIATASTSEKRVLLQKRGADYVLDSVGVGFGQAIRETIGPRCVDVGLGAVFGDELRVSLNLLSVGGRYIDIGKIEIVENKALLMSCFHRNVGFFGLDIDNLLNSKFDTIRSLIAEVLQRFANGTYKPLSTTKLPLDQVGDAVKILADRKRIGPVVIGLTPNDFKVPDRVRIRRDGTYLVTGGMSGFGLEVAKELARSGAGTLLLLSRSGASTDEARSAVNNLKKMGAQVVAVAVDVSNRKKLEQVLGTVRKQCPKLRGVFHGAMVLDDRPLVAMDDEAFARVFAPKVEGALNLHRLTLPDSLDIFVLFSSVSALVGNDSQSNYAAANGALADLTYARRALDLPSTTIDLGALSESGVLSRQVGVKKLLESSGIKGVGNHIALQALWNAFSDRMAHVGVFDIDWEQIVKHNSRMKESSLLRQFVASQALYRNHTLEVIGDLLQYTPAERCEQLTERLKGVLSEVVRISPDQIDTTQSLIKLGLDSLVAAEFGIAAENEFGVGIPTAQLIDGRSVEQLAQSVSNSLANYLKSNEVISTEFFRFVEEPMQAKLNEWLEGGL